MYLYYTGKFSFCKVEKEKAKLLRFAFG